LLGSHIYEGKDPAARVSKITLDIYSHVSLDVEKQAAVRLDAALQATTT
jgi:hypothetical protein